jgi:hypothetical protein
LEEVEKAVLYADAMLKPLNRQIGCDWNPGTRERGGEGGKGRGRGSIPLPSKPRSGLKEPRLEAVMDDTYAIKRICCCLGIRAVKSTQGRQQVTPST